MRTKVKKLTSVILAVVMMLGILTIAPLTVSAATYGDFEYTIENNSTCTITKYNGSAANVTIPSTIYGYKVCKVGDWAFSKNLNLKNITLPNSITCIDWAAFHDCTKLEHINIPNSITYIGGGAFEDCAKLEHITIPNSVTYIGDCAFYGCTSLDNIVIPGGAELSAQTTGSTFAECTNLKSVVIENGVTTIVQAIFENCVNLENVTIPNTVTEIYPLAFIGCTKLKSITIPKSVKTIVKSAGKTMGYYRDNDNNYIKIADFTIKGYKGTAAEEYAKENGFKFIALDVSEPTSVSLNKTSLTLDVSKSYTLTKTVSPSNAVTSYTWSSSNTSVATVDKNGKVTAKASGTATITVKTSNGKTATCKVTVNLPTPQITSLANTTGGIKISWNKVSGAYGYRLYYKPASGGWKRFKDTTATSFTDSGVSPNRTETYTIRCIDKNGNTVSGFYSKGWSMTYTPVAPTISKLENTSGGIKISWNKIAGVYGYRLYYKTSSGGWKRFKDTTATSFTDSGVSPNRTETYTIRCIDKNGNTVSGFYSKGWSMTYTPVAPTISKLENTSGGIKISWNKIAGVYGYRLYYKTSSGGWKRFKDTTATSFTDSGVSPNRTETYTIRCIDKNGNTISGFNSNGWSKKYTPVAPTISKLENTSGGIKISWNKIAGVYGYRLYYKTSSGGWKRFKDTTATSFTDSGVSPNRTETYTIRCIDKNGNTVSGFYSRGWSKKYTPVAPTITRLSNTSNGVSVAWNKIAGVYGYRLYRKYDGGSWTKVKDTTSTSFTDSGAKKGKKATYTVRCIDRKGKTVSGFNSKGWSITRK